MELLKNYDCQIIYHPGKPNVVADVMSRKSMGSLAYVSVHKRELAKELRDLFDMRVHFEFSDSTGLITQFQVRPMMIDEIKANQDKDPLLIRLKEKVQIGQAPGFCIIEGVLRHGDRLYVPHVDGLRQKILQ